MATNVFELVCYNRYRQARLVLEAGGDPNFRNEIGETPLMACAMFIRDECRRTQLMRMLIGFGADVNAQNDKGQTLMIYACILDQGDTLLMLLDKVGVDLNLHDVSGNTCLMYACALDRAALVYVLLDGYQSGRLSVNVYHRNHEGQTAREIAEQRNLVHISDLFTDTVNKDYWSSFGELSRELDYPNQRTYPLQIDEDPVTVKDPGQPLASMVERILHVSQEQATTDDPGPTVLTSRKDSAGGISIKTMTSGDSYLGSASSAVGRQEPRSPKQHVSLENDSSRATGRALSRTDSSRRRSFKSRQSTKSNGAHNQIKAGLLHQVEISSRSFESSHNVKDVNSGHSELSKTGPYSKIAPESTRSSISEINSPGTAKPQRINYYARHDIQVDSMDTNLNVIEGPGDFHHTPRPPTRAKSRARRRKTTEVYVTVSEGKIVPYNTTQKQTDKTDNMSTKNNGMHNTVSEQAHYDTTSAMRNFHSPTTVPISTRSPSISRQIRERALDRESVPSNSINTERFASRERSSLRLRCPDFDQNGLSNSVHKENGIKGFDPRIDDNSDMTYDSLIGKSSFESALKKKHGYTHIPIHDGNHNNIRKSSSFKQTPRENGSNRAVAW